MRFLKIPKVLKIFFLVLLLIFAAFCSKALINKIQPSIITDSQYQLQASDSLGKTLTQQGWLLSAKENFEFIWLLIYKSKLEAEIWSQRGLVGHFKIKFLNSTPGRKVFNSDGKLPEGFYKIENLISIDQSPLGLKLNFPTQADSRELILKPGESPYQLRIGISPGFEIQFEPRDFNTLIDIFSRAPSSERHIAIYPTPPPLKAGLGDSQTTINLYQQLEVLHGKIKKFSKKL